ncbi:MAG: MFS transporter [archaeon]
MGFTIIKPKGVIFSKILKLAIVLLIASVGFSFIDTFWAVYLESFIHNIALVGFISSILAFISFFSFFFIVPLIEKYDKAKTFSISLFFIAISYFVFSITKNFYIFLAVAVIATIFHNLRITSFGIIVKNKSSKKKLSRNEGVMYTLLNLAWFIGPLIAGLLSRYYSINIIFGLAGFIVLIALIHFSFLKIHEVETRKIIDKNVIKLFKDFFKDKKRVIAYFLGGGVNYWWSLIYIFIPIYIIENGLKVSYVGYFLFAITIPLIAFTYFFSNLAGKIGFKKIFKIGFFIVFSAALICFFVSNIYLILLILILASTGISMLESTTEAYFFDTLKGKEDLRFYGPYNTTIDLNHFISRVLGGLVLLFFPFKFIFLLFSISMLGFFFLSSKTKNIKEINRKN